MVTVALLLVVLHYAIVVEVIFDWLKYRCFHWVVKTVFITSAWVMYLVVVFNISRILGFTAFAMLAVALISWLIAGLLIRKI